MNAHGRFARTATSRFLLGALVATACAGAVAAPVAGNPVRATEAGGAPVVPSEASIVQGGIVTLPVATNDTQYSDGAFKLMGSPLLSTGSDDPHAAAYAGKIGYEFTNMAAGGGNLTLYVGANVPAGTYMLAAVRTANYARSVVKLQVLPVGHVYVTTPAEGYQKALGKLQPGDVLELHAGTYSGTAVLTASGTAARPITIRGYGRGEALPLIKYTGTTSNEWEIRGSHLIVEGLAFDSTHTNPIRIRKPSNGAIEGVTIVGNTFVDCGDICVTANDPGVSYAHVRILYNLVLEAHQTGFYIGQQNGQTPVDDFLFEGNVLDARGVSAPHDEGYGIETKLNVRDATLRNNYILGTQGPGIMTYGLQAGADPGYASVVDRNIVIGACNDQNILTGAGPAVVSNNLAIGGAEYGYGIQDYHQWHLLAHVQYLGNTSLLNGSGGFWSESKPSVSGIADLRMIGNRAYPAPGRPGFVNLPPNVPPAAVEDNTVHAPTAAMSAAAVSLQTQVPSPQALQQAVWPMLAAGGSLLPVPLQNVLGTLTALPNQSSNHSARVCH